MRLIHEAMIANEVAVDGVVDAIAHFASKVEALGVRVERRSDPIGAAEIVAGIASELSVADVLVTGELANLSSSLVRSLEAHNLRITVPLTEEEARDRPLGVSLAPLAIVETGSVLLAESTLADRSIGLLTIGHIVICRTGDLVPTLDDAAVTLKSLAMQPHGAYASLVTGPSRTADIEMSLTVGVQGPARLWVIFVDNLA